jgi:hypothetical protein
MALDEIERVRLLLVEFGRTEGHRPKSFVELLRKWPTALPDLLKPGTIPVARTNSDLATFIEQQDDSKLIKLLNLNGRYDYSPDGAQNVYLNSADRSPVILVSRDPTSGGMRAAATMDQTGLIEGQK